MALEGSQRLDAFLRFSELGAVKVGEWAIVVLLALHLCFGLRVLALEMLPGAAARDPHLRWIDLGVVLALAFGLAFALMLIG